MRTPAAPWALAALLSTVVLPSTAPALLGQPIDDVDGVNEVDLYEQRRRAGRLDRLERRMGEMEQKHQADLKARDEEIVRLKAQLQQQSAAAPAAPPGVAPAGVAPSAGSGEDDAVEKTRQDVLADLESREKSPFTFRAPASFTPDIAVISDFLGAYSNNRGNDALNRFDVREVELDLRAAVDPRADGVVILAFERDVENPVFPEAGEEEEGGGPESSVNVEEAYLFLHDFGVPNLTAKLGRYHVRFGRQNLLHLHDLPTADPPLVNQAFLSPESLTDSGLSLSYVVPPRLVFDQYVEGIVELITGEGAGSESPTFAGDLTVDSPAVNTHVLWNTDLGRDWNLELGASWLMGHADADNARDVNLYGADATLLRTDPTGRFNNQLLQAEVIYGDVDQEGGETAHAWGAYVLGQQQLHKDWYAGLRLDWTQNPNAADEEAWAVSPYVSWYWNESLRFRLQYQHRDGDVEAEDNLYFQATWIFGAHPPHPYWSMR